MSWFLGLDNSTQSMSGIIVDVEKGDLIAEESVKYGEELPHYGCPQGVLENDDPLVKQSDPVMWVEALEKLFGKFRNSGIDLSRICAISGSGQQHGTVYLNNTFNDSQAWNAANSLPDAVRGMLSRPVAPVWMDSSTSDECKEIAEKAGGNAVVQRLTGSPAVERFSGPQIRKFHKHYPDMYEETAVIHLISSFMAAVLTGGASAIEPGDGAGMNLMNLERRDWDADMLSATAPGLLDKLPTVVASDSQVGTLSEYFTEKYGFAPDTPVIAWTGDNPNSLIGVGGWQPGTAVISLGTSDTFFAAMNEARVDPNGYGHVFGNPAGGYMSLICFKNGSLARERIKDRFELSWDEFDNTAFEQTPAGNNGNMMLPYFVSEITPHVLEACPVYRGSESFAEGREPYASTRAVVEAQAMSMRMHSAWMESSPSTVRVTGGGAKSNGICRVLADVFNSNVERLEVGNSAALGAALRAAQGAGEKQWQALTETFCSPDPALSVAPIPKNVAVYEELMPAFKELVNEKRQAENR